MVEVADLTPETFFDPEDGLIGQVKPDFRARKGQAAFSELVMAVSEEHGRHVLAEAPTGFGKSFAALVPAIILAVQQKKRVVISTETIALQDQYFLKDLPLLLKACKKIGITFSFAVAKGRGNYICRTKLDEDVLDGNPRTTELQKWAKLQQIGLHSGDKASVPFAMQDREWRDIGADDDCERKACPFYGEGSKGETECFVYHGQRNSKEADIVVTNHTLFLLDCMAENALLGPYSTAIIDEAHTIPERAQAAWGMEIGPRTVSRTLKIGQRMLRRAGLNHFEAGFLDTYIDLEDRMFGPFFPFLKNSRFLESLPIDVVGRSKEAAQELIKKLVTENKMLNDFGKASGESEIVDAVREKIYKLLNALRAIYGEDVADEYKDNWVIFLEANQNWKGEKFGILHLKPIDVAPLIRGAILDVVPNVVFMSATLKIGDSFGFMRKELGLRSDNTTVEFTGETPFDYYNSVQGYFADDLPDPDEDDYVAALTKRIRTIIRRRNGRCLVLFTSAERMRQVHAKLSVDTKVPYRCYVQGEASKNALIEHFKEDIGSCLFATRSFFTGVDIPGEALSTVILDRAPFRVPSDPLFKAKTDKLEDRGIDSFRNYSMPLMLMDVRQAFGRLIRSIDDVGMFCFLDSRANNKPYGRQIKNCLPRMKIVDVVEKV